MLIIHSFQQKQDVNNYLGQWKWKILVSYDVYQDPGVIYSFIDLRVSTPYYLCLT